MYISALLEGVDIACGFSPGQACCTCTSSVVVTSWPRRRLAWRHPPGCRSTAGTPFAPCPPPAPLWRGSATPGSRVPAGRSWCSLYGPHPARTPSTSRPDTNTYCSTHFQRTTSILNYGHLYCTFSVLICFTLKRNPLILKSYPLINKLYIR